MAKPQRLSNINLPELSLERLQPELLQEVKATETYVNVTERNGKATGCDITWDDVRKTKTPKLKRVLIFIPSVVLVISGLFYMHVKASPVVSSVAQPVPTAEASKPVKPYIPSLCEKLKSWSGSSSLRLGLETKKFCK